jgi:hypothetical protein
VPPEYVTIAAEGDVDAQIGQRVLDLVGLNAGPVYVQRGKNRLDSRILAYNNAARFAHWLVLRDMDHDASCAPELVRQLLPEPAQMMMLRIAIRSIEAWLLADRERMSRFLGLSVDVVPADPERLAHPKRALVDLARRSGRRAVREDMVPRDGSSHQVGPGYTGQITEFANRLWRPDAAADRSESLSRCIRALERWAG